jgi:hypothetical protein
MFSMFLEQIPQFFVVGLVRFWNMFVLGNIGSLVLGSDIYAYPEVQGKAGSGSCPDEEADAMFFYLRSIYRISPYLSSWVLPR